jgi:hypothetical protein
LKCFDSCGMKKVTGAAPRYSVSRQSSLARPRRRGRRESARACGRDRRDGGGRLPGRASAGTVAGHGRRAPAQAPGCGAVRYGRGVLAGGAAPHGGGSERSGGPDGRGAHPGAGCGANDGERARRDSRTKVRPSLPLLRQQGLGHAPRAPVPERSRCREEGAKRRRSGLPPGRCVRQYPTPRC